jgi:NADH-quinone oxidoreductase subunit C
MEPMEVAKALETEFPGDVVEVREFRDQVTVTVNRERIVAICRWLHDDPSTAMDFLSDLCAVDYPESELRFSVVYNLYSLSHRHRIRIKAGLPEDDLSIDSVVPVWRGADWFEREAFDLFGIDFLDHPDLRRLLLPDNWRGYPLRKEYPLKGLEDWEYPEYEEAMELHRHDDEWTVGRESDK